LWRAGLDRRNLALAALARRLSAQSPEARLARWREKARGLGERLPILAERRLREARRLVDQQRERFSRAFAARLALERRDMARWREAFDALARRLSPAMVQGLDRRRRMAGGMAQLLNSLGYRQVLARGYALVRDETGLVIRDAAHVADGQRIGIEFADGRIEAVTGEGGGAARSPTRSARQRMPGSDQGSLF
jgi:exodeoxyribonuclease VII large subunit